MSDWSLVFEGFDPEKERLREALCTLGNGYFATRGAAPESEADPIHYPGTYLAGGYNRLKTDIAGRTIENEDLVNLPNWLLFSFRTEGANWLSIRAVDILSYQQELDFRKGILLRKFVYQDNQGRRTMVTNRRFVNMGNHHLGGLEVTITPQNWSGQINFRSGLDGRIVNAGVERYKALNNKHLQPLETTEVENDGIFLLMETTQSKLRVAEAARTQFFLEDSLINVNRQLVSEPGYLAHECSLNLKKGQELIVEKIAALYTSRDRAISECGQQAQAAIKEADRFSPLVRTHIQRWDRLWQRSDIILEDGQESQWVLRFHLFHLLQTASPNSIDLDVGIPARGLHGEAYRGHIFWDELFILPLLNLRIPDITKSLLQYRYRRLNQARRNAQAAGFRGAMYPWQSGSTGREESQNLHLNPESGRWTPDNTRLQRHVNAAIVFNTWQYYQVTGDSEFLSFYGGEMILEIARLFASMTSYNQTRNKYEVRNVMGPDEYHDRYPEAEVPGLHNNSYTNIMAVWVLCRALDVMKMLPDDHRTELRQVLHIQKQEVEHWDEISRNMYIPHHDEGIISQFEGYDRLEEFDWERYRLKYGEIQRLDRILEAEGDTTNRYKVSKQADVLMLFYLFSSEELRQLFRRLGYPFKYETIPLNIKYYLSRTSHGSSLSRVVHSWVTARSDREKAWEWLQEDLKVDIDDIQLGTTPEGIHLGAMAGTVDLVQRVYTGIETRGDTLFLNPCLPAKLEGLGLRIFYRGHSLDIRISHKNLTVSSQQGIAPSIKIGVRKKRHTLKPGHSIKVQL
jgi:alpha,alpha-trehalase